MGESWLGKGVWVCAVPQNPRVEFHGLGIEPWIYQKSMVEFLAVNEIEPAILWQYNVIVCAGVLCDRGV